MKEAVLSPSQEPGARGSGQMSLKDDIREAQRDLAAVMSMLILQGLGSMVSASRRRQPPLVHQGTARFTHNPHIALLCLQVSWALGALGGQQGGLACLCHQCQHRAATQHGSEEATAQLCAYSKHLVKYCDGVLGTARLGCPRVSQEDCFIPSVLSRNTPPTRWTQYRGTESPSVLTGQGTPAPWQLSAPMCCPGVLRCPCSRLAGTSRGGIAPWRSPAARSWCINTPAPSTLGG
ncbi:uncharacterized protein LOC109274207 [Panthera pardus]|uniref:Uncharacterized protein LOC109274207 n=1 Tax=Panthera pardus TaxID=9691 RepID=A0A9V1G811_PANPR|nr:uncharacterized protein LOC109274207 [Panthera pardus]